MVTTPLDRIRSDVVACRACPRLVAWREAVARAPRAAYAGQAYWARPVPGFGDPAARLLVIGLAPAAHGGNRTGRVFTGDRSGDWLFAALWRAGFANQPTSTSADDGLRLTDCYITAPVKCAPPDNRPTPAERDACRPFLLREVAVLPAVVVLALGAFGFEAAWRAYQAPGRRPRFGHGVEAPLPGGRTLLASYHVSQQNTFTGRLTEPMFDRILGRAKELLAAAG